VSGRDGSVDDRGPGRSPATPGGLDTTTDERERGRGCSHLGISTARHAAPVRRGATRRRTHDVPTNRAPLAVTKRARSRVKLANLFEALVTDPERDESFTGRLRSGVRCRVQ
jgi:hypothetical protein